MPCARVPALFALLVVAPPALAQVRPSLVAPHRTPIRVTTHLPPHWPTPRQRQEILDEHLIDRAEMLKLPYADRIGPRTQISESFPRIHRWVSPAERLQITRQAVQTGDHAAIAAVPQRIAELSRERYPEHKQRQFIERAFKLEGFKGVHDPDGGDRFAKNLKPAPRRRIAVPINVRPEIARGLTRRPILLNPPRLESESGAISAEENALAPDPNLFHSTTPAPAPPAPAPAELARARLDAALARADYPAAADACDELLDIAPGDAATQADLRRLKALAQLASGRTADGIATLAAACRDHPGHFLAPPEPLPLSASRLSRALRDTVRVAHDADTPDAWLAVSLLMQMQGRDRHALRMLDRALQRGLDPQLAAELRDALGG